MAFRCRLLDRFMRPWLLRVDLREGLPEAESSSLAPPFLLAAADRLRSAVPLIPAFRSVALVAGLAVSTGTSRRGRRGRFGFGGFASLCCCALKLSLLVAMIS